MVNYCATSVLLGVFTIFFTILIVLVLLVCCLPNSFIILKVHATRKRDKFKNWPKLLEKKTMYLHFYVRADTYMTYTRPCAPR